MKRELITSIEVNAPANIVWRVLTDFGKYPQWNPFIRSISGAAKQDAKLKIYLQPPGGSEMTFHPVVLVAPARTRTSLAWAPFCTWFI